jgi:osmotically-inducible protein OsmY
MMRRAGGTDSQIQRAVVKRLDWAAGVRSEHIGVAVTDGAVTLAGEAIGTAEKVAAVAEATRVRGVVAVVDEIVVRGVAGMVNDADIARSAQAMLTRHPSLRDEPITATVVDHVLRLHGDVQRATQRDAADRAAEAIAGVMSVVNEIRVRAAPTVAQTKAHIATALARGSEIEVAHLRTDIDGDKVTLQGNVHSCYERRAAERAARSVPGVTNVDNQLVVSV